MPGTDNQRESGQPGDDPNPPRELGQTWASSLWLWPAVAISLASTAGTFFGSFGTVLTSGVLATILMAAGILVASKDRRLAFGLAAALTASLVVIASSVRVHDSDDESRHQSTTSTVENPHLPVKWPGRVISQSMADEADFGDADLDGANLNDIQLSHKNFDGVQADGASFRGSQLEYANLRDASLRGACLDGANLTGANLTGADFSGADVANVTVSQQATRAALVWPTDHSAPVVVCPLRFMSALTRDCVSAQVPIDVINRIRYGSVLDPHSNRDLLASPRKAAFPKVREHPSCRN
jgi:hypothetical protein